jgi:hypothetical protein
MTREEEREGKGRREEGRKGGRNQGLLANGVAGSASKFHSIRQKTTHRTQR